LFLGARLAASGRLSLGAFVLAFGFIGAIADFALSFDLIASAWQYLRGAEDRLKEMLALGSPPVEGGVALPDLATGLELRDVSLDLGGRLVLDRFDLTVEPGRLVVLRGAPGSGKTTVAGVAVGMYPPSTGRALIDGVEIPQLQRVPL